MARSAFDVNVILVSMSQDFFFSRLGTWIMRTDPKGEARTFYLARPKDPTKEYEYVKYYHGLQAVGVKFAPILTVHNRLEECESCSA